MGGSALVVVTIGLATVGRRFREGDEQLPVPPNAQGAASIQPETESYSDAEINRAANQLFAAVHPSLPENRHFTPFAKDKLSWIVNEQKAGRLSLMLLKNIGTTNLDAEALMAAARVDDNKPVIVIARPRFVAFLIEGGRTSVPFTQQQRNDFALGLVHEAVHLQNPQPGDPARLDDRLLEELRAWREVSLHVVREWRRTNQPMNPRVIQADDALRSCGDQLPCQPLMEILLPTERGRH